jgi:hypothetical protein
MMMGNLEMGVPPPNIEADEEHYYQVRRNILVEEHIAANVYGDDNGGPVMVAAGVMHTIISQPHLITMARKAKFEGGIDLLTIRAAMSLLHLHRILDSPFRQHFSVL